MAAINFIVGSFLCGTHLFVIFGFYLRVFVSQNHEEAVGCIAPVARSTSKRFLLTKEMPFLVRNFR